MTTSTSAPLQSVETRLLLIRHGETPWNVARRWQGHADPGLTEKGRAQAVAVARSLETEPRGRWTRIIASDLARARLTAETIARSLDLPIELDRRLRELDVGDWSGLTRDEIATRDPDRLLAFETGDPSIRPSGGETRLELAARAVACLRDLRARYAGEGLVVVTHRGVIRALVADARPSNADRFEVSAEAILSLQ